MIRLMIIIVLFPIIINSTELYLNIHSKSMSFARKDKSVENKKSLQKEAKCKIQQIPRKEQNRDCNRYCKKLLD